MMPKLVFFLECLPSDSFENDESLACLDEALHAFFSLPGWGPVLRLDPTETKRMWQDIDSAMDAML